MTIRQGTKAQIFNLVLSALVYVYPLSDFDRETIEFCASPH